MPGIIAMDALYKAIGRRIREARERGVPKVSQAKLAQYLAISRASIVNIEAGRQHAPLHVLWQIAEKLDIELSMLIPRRAELADTGNVVELNDAMRRQIQQEANGNPALEKSITTIVGRIISNIEAVRPGKRK